MPKGKLKLVDQHGTRRWAYYTLNVPTEVKVIALPQTDEEKIIAYVREHGSISNSECRDLLNVGIHRASHLLKKMAIHGLLKKKCECRWEHYYSP